MNEPYAPAPGYSNQPGYPPPPRQGMGCFAKGCITIVILLMVLGVLFGAGAWFLVRSVMGFVSPTPVAIRTYPATDEQYQDVIGRYKTFIQALNAGQAATFALSADDMNILIARDPEFKDVRGKMFMSIEKDELIAEASFPIPKDTKKFNSGNSGYFNGRIRFGASYTNGDLTVFVRKIESMDGKAMSDFMVSILNKLEPGQGFKGAVSEGLRNNEAWAQAMSRVQKIVVEDGKIVATAVAGTPTEKPVPLPDESPVPVASPSDSQ